MSRTDRRLRHGRPWPTGASSPRRSSVAPGATVLKEHSMATTSVEERVRTFACEPAGPVPDAQEVRLCLLGSWRLLPVHGGPVPPNGQRLLALLALNGRQSRAHVAATLWP